MIKPIENWLARHQNPTSFWLHMLGIPACFFATPMFLFLQQWALATVMFVAGYALQFLGHYIEGNRSGEEILLRKLFGIKETVEEPMIKASRNLSSKKKRKKKRK